MKITKKLRSIVSKVGTGPWSAEVFCRKDWVLSVKSEETYDWVPCSKALEIPKYNTACENAKLDGNYDE